MPRRLTHGTAKNGGSPKTAARPQASARSPTEAAAQPQPPVDLEVRERGGAVLYGEPGQTFTQLFQFLRAAPLEPHFLFVTENAL